MYRKNLGINNLMVNTEIISGVNQCQNICVRRMRRINLSRNYKLLLILITSCVVAIFIVWRSLKVTSLPRSKFQTEYVEPREIPLVLWWTPILQNYHSERQCGFHKCIFTVHRNLTAMAKLVLFYGSDMNKTDLPLPRQANQLWALLHEESPKNIPFIPHDVLLQHFNFTSTFSRHSDFPLTTQYLTDLEQLTTSKYLVPIGEKTHLRQHQHLAPVVFLQSICDTMSGRDEYVKALMQHLPVDSYGKCLHNKDLPAKLRENYLNLLDSPDLYRFLARYKFILSYENGICNDYISEKFWRPLIIGSIPIYFGAPTIKDWQPNNKSVIHISDFSNPKALADFIIKLDSNDSEYNSYLKHKYSQLHPITNKLLVNTVIERLGSDVDNIFDLFECYVCQQVHEMSSNSGTHRATHRHYDCPQPLAYPPMTDEAMQRLRNSDWNSIAAVGKCQARILDKLLHRNTKFTQQEFDDLLNQEIRLNKCNFH